VCVYIYIYKRVPDALALAWTARLERQVWHCGLIVFLKKIKYCFNCFDLKNNLYHSPEQ
jgi:hypothetical protein